jgi:L,D-peptidoglycan transpeptidase YkuD (ErfK/YbiS/YcfS/YnhG family)
VLTVDASKKDSTRAIVRLWTWRKDRWVLDAGPWNARLGRGGLGKRIRGDNKTPLGIFGLTSAGGLYPAPHGTKLPYKQSSAYRYRSGFGKYVVRIDYNVARRDLRKTPKATPAAVWSKGSGIWLHNFSASGSATGGCVALPLTAMQQVIKSLRPDLAPKIEIRRAKR